MISDVCIEPSQTSMLSLRHLYRDLLHIICKIFSQTSVVRPLAYYRSGTISDVCIETFSTIYVRHRLRRLYRDFQHVIDQALSDVCIENFSTMYIRHLLRRLYRDLQHVVDQVPPQTSVSRRATQYGSSTISDVCVEVFNTL